MVDATGEEGQTLEVSYEVDNTGDAEDTQDIRLLRDGTEVDADTSITLAPADAPHTGTLLWDTQSGDAGTYTVEVASDDDTDSIQVEVVKIPDAGDLHTRYDATQLSLSDGAEVTSWPDATGNGYGLSGSGPTYQTGQINGNAVVSFDGSGSDSLQTTFSAIAQPTTFFCVFDANAFDNGSVIESADGTDRQVIRAGVDGSGSDASTWSYWAGNTFYNSEQTNLAIVTVVFDGANSIIRVNGTEYTGDPGTNGLSGLTVGSQYDQANNFYDGSVGEILLYPMDKSGIVSDVESYLANKWGISL